jgi:hypothetical protein
MDSLSNKEFVLYGERKEKRPKRDDIIPKFMINANLPESNYFDMYSHQLFIENYMDPNTPFKRILVKWETGMGKTFGSLGIANNYINYYQKQRMTGSTIDIGSVYIIGFTHQLYINDLLQYPEFGFITRDELARYNKIKQLAEAGNVQAIDNFSRFNAALKKRLSNRERNGFFKFLGYRELYNHLITKGDIPVDASEIKINKLIEEGKIQLDEELLATFNNSLIICDEIHNVYNTTEMNSWGSALKILFNRVKTCRVVLLSATPINNSPTEVVDLLNLLLPRQDFPELKRSDFFDSEGRLLAGAADKIGSYFIGRVSFIISYKAESVVTRRFVGDCIRGIDYLRFIRCPMSAFQMKTYSTLLATGCMKDARNIYDIVFPDPSVQTWPKNVGIFKSEAVRDAYLSASSAWSTKNNIAYDPSNDTITGAILEHSTLAMLSSKYATMLEHIFKCIKEKKGKIFIFHSMIHMTGTLLIQEIFNQNGMISETDLPNNSTLCVHCCRPRSAHSEKELLSNTVIVGGATYKTYKTHFEYKKDNITIHYECVGDTVIIRDGAIWVDDPDHPMRVQDILEWLSGKHAIIHVSNSVSILFNKQFTNIFGDYITDLPDISSYNDTLTTVVDDDLSIVDDDLSIVGGGHMYEPVRYILIRGGVDKKQLVKSLDKFNSHNNMRGQKFFIVLGSRIIKESYNMRAVRNLFIMSKPDNIPTMLQIIGRAVRLTSHVDLPKEERNVDIHVFVSSTGQVLSLEEIKYKNKVNTYKTIQEIERQMHVNAIDVHFNYDRISKVFKANKDFKLAILEYKKPKASAHDLMNLSKFNAYYAEQEVNYIIKIIKRLFLEESSVWTYDDLLAAVKWPPFDVEINTDLISTTLFNIAINKLIYDPDVISIPGTSTNLMDKLRDPDDVVVLTNGSINYMIVQHGHFFVLTPSVYGSNFDIFNRNIRQSNSKILEITDYLVHDQTHNYQSKRIKFVNKWKNVTINQLESCICDFGIGFHQEFIEETISYIFNMWTSPHANKHEFHVFYMKMLYFYDLHKLIMWADTASTDLLKLYKNYIGEVKVKKTKIDQSSDDVGYINALVDEVSKSDLEWVTTGIINAFTSKIKEAEKMFNGIYKKNSKSITKANPSHLPIGHYILPTIRVYDPSTSSWNEYSTKSGFTNENSIIVGYDERSATGIQVKFKLRKPIGQLKKHKDRRLMEKGTACSTASKSFLNSLASKLDLDVTKLSITDICTAIRTELIYREIKNRGKTKWFYFVYETQPDIFYSS